MKSGDFMNLGESKNLANSYIANYSNGGVIISDGDNADYNLRYNRLANAAQIQVNEYNSIRSVYSISQNPIDPLNGRFYGFTIKQFTGTDLTDICGINAQSYYFEVDRPCTVLIEESSNNITWSTLQTLTITGIRAFKAYKGLITPTLATNQVRLRFTGSYPFNVRNRALWNVSFASADDVPVYSDRIRYTMPNDFYKLDKIIHRTDDRVYESMVDFQWEGRKDLILNYFYSGSFDVQYFKYPCKIYDSLSTSTVTTETGTLVSGGTSTVTLPSTSSTIDKYYNGQTIEITGGTGIGLKAVCIDYVAKTNILTVQTPFSITLDNTSTYAIKQYTDDSYIFETYEEGTQAIPFYLGAHALMDEMPSLGTMLLNEYNSRLANLQTIQNTSNETITNYSGW